MAFTKSGDFTNVDRNSTFNQTVTITGDGTVASISSRSISGNDDAGITTSSSVSGTDITFRVKGQYKDLFDNDTIQYVERGASDKSQTPTTINSLGAIPAGKDLISVVQDSRTSITKTYTVSITYVDTDGATQTESVTVDQVVDAGTRAFQNALHEYLVDAIKPSEPITALAYNKSKPLGCNNTGTVGSGVGRSADLDFPYNYTEFWNTVSAGNPAKWKAVESTLYTDDATAIANYDWEGFDYLYKWTKSRGMKFYWHTLLWAASSALPSWFSGLSEADSKHYLDRFLNAVATRFPDIDGIQTVNEIYTGHQSGTPDVISQFGGAGTTGYDWLIYVFGRARHYFPNAKLWLNDFGVISNSTVRQSHIDACNALKNNGNLIDAVGCQGHYFNLNDMSATDITTALDDITTQTSLPIMITELDLSGYDADDGGNDSEAKQLERYQTVFPALYNHSNVERITIWGYIIGETWRHDAGHVTGLIDREGNNKRSALTYLESFMSSAT